MSIITDTEVKKRGLSALMDALGEVDAERFIMLLNRDPFDYTTWQRDAFQNNNVKEISAQAMRLRSNENKL